MKKKDLLLISSAISAGFLAVSSKNPVFSNWATVFMGISAYLATAPRISHKTRLQDKFDKILSKKFTADIEKKENGISDR